MDIVKTFVIFGGIALVIELLILLYNYVSRRTGGKTTDIDSGTVIFLLVIGSITFIIIGEIYKALTQ